MRLKVRRSPRGSSPIPGRALLALTAVAALILATAATASAEYTTATPLSTGKATSSVAVNQANGDLYAASLGTTNLGFFQSGSLKHFNSSGTEIACSLSGLTKDGFNATHPASVAVDPESEDVYVGNVTTESTSGLYDFPAACGSPNAIAEGSGDTHETSTEITSVSTSSGAFEVGQFLSGTGIPASTAIVAIGAGSLTLSAAATADGTGVALSSTSFNVGANNGNPVPQGATDSEGNLYWPDPISGTLQKYAPGGEEIALANPIEGLTKPASVALDAAGDLYVASGVLQCSEPEAAAGTLQKYAPDGELLETFAGLTSEVSTVAVDRSTGDVFVGRGCVSTTTPFRVEKYSEGGSMLAEFGEGLFATGGATANLALNQLAVDEASGTVYAADAGHGQVQVFEYTAPAEPHTLTVTPASVGNVHSYPTGAINCSSTASNCTQEYLEGEEATMVATQPSGTVFTGWNGCEGAEDNAEGRVCHIKMDGDRTLEATYSSTYLLSAAVTGTGIGNVHSSPFGINCGAGLACAANFPSGEEVRLTAAVPSGSSVAWSGECDQVVGRTCVIEEMTGPKNVHATYTQLQLLKVTHAGTGGNVHSYPNAINCGAGSLCSAYFATGTHVTLVATQPSGTTFEGWSGDCDEVTGPGNRYCVIEEMDGTKEVTAAYAP